MSDQAATEGRRRPGGIHASLPGFCLKSPILGNELLARVQRCLRGI
jgi:hypothetical protein